MNNTSQKETSAIYTVTGFFSGLLITLLIYLLLFAVTEKKFTFDLLALFHTDIPLLFIVDALPFAGILVGTLLSIKHNRFLQVIDERSKRESAANDFMKLAIQNLTRGNLNASMTDNAIEQELIHNLVALQSRLKENRESELQNREADKQRNWSSHGLAEFGDILRTYSSDRKQLGYAVISNLVRYLDINQGGFFVISEQKGKRTLEMIACHAYDRNKFPDQTINWGEGLIGAVAIEKKSYYTDKIPDGYLTITSGLGRAGPRHLLIVPLVLNDEVFGVFELASFNKFEEHHIQLVERVAENTATTLNILYSNLRTEQLLKETQEQAAQLTRQEEKVLQNINELKETQAEAARQSEEFVSFTNTVNHTLIRAEYNNDGKLLYANTRFLKMLGYSGNREVEGMHLTRFIHEEDRAWFDKIWERLAGGGAHFEGYMRHVTKMGQDLWIMATYTCVRNEDNSIGKVLFLALDATSQKRNNLRLEGQINAINKLSPNAEFSPDGRLLVYNDLFESTLKYPTNEFKNKNIFDFIAQSDQERFNEIWEQVVAGTAYQGQLRMIGKFEEEVWFRTTFTSLIDIYGEVDKILFLAFEITKEKELEYFMRTQNEKLKENEEQTRLKSLDLKKQIGEMEQVWLEEKRSLQRETSIYSNILENQPLPAIGVNNQGFIVIYNRAAENFYGKSPKKVINKPIHVLFKENQTDPAIQAFIDPGKPIIETTKKRVSLPLHGQKMKEADISIIKTESGSELIYTLLIHSDY
ncbi:MAG: PAS domain-containing protein [Bacteroidales bacterium]